MIIHKLADSINYVINYLHSYLPNQKSVKVKNDILLFLTLKTLIYDGTNGIKPLVKEFVTYITKIVAICNYWYISREWKFNTLSRQ